MLAQILFEQRVSRLAEFERVLFVNRRLNTSEVRGERGLRAHEVEFGDGARRQPD